MGAQIFQGSIFKLLKELYSAAGQLIHLFLYVKNIIRPHKNNVLIKQSIDKSREEYKKLEELNNNLYEKVKERTKQLETLNEQRTHNFINLVHETKTPLTLVNNYLDEFINRHGTGEELDIIKGGINKLTKDISSLFDIERFNKGFSTTSLLKKQNL